ncbi:MAG: hypothetical protein PHR98_02840 [Candidatus Shapirobacteria bacterium]|nr:hypothetical protein [Candidatus Shapirobacteria bacterium]
MSNFEARIQRQQEAILQERMKKEAEERVALKEVEAIDAQRLDLIKSDERFNQIKEVAYSPELKQALEKYRRLFGWPNMDYNGRESFDISNKEHFNILFSDKEDPVGSFRVYVRFMNKIYGDEGVPDRGPEDAVVRISWRDEPTKRKLVYKTSGSKGSGSKEEYDGADAREGLGIEFYHSKFKDTEKKSVPVFYELDAFLNYLAKLVVTKMENHYFKEEQIYEKGIGI